VNLYDLIKPYRGGLFFAVFLTSLESMSVLLLPWLGGQLLGSVYSLSRIGLNELFALLAVAIAAYLLFKMLTYFWIVAVFEKILADLKVKVYAHVQSLPISFHNRSMQGDLLALVTSEVERLSDFMTGTLVNCLPMIFTLLGATLLLFAIDQSLALLVLLLLPGSLIVIKLFARKIRLLGREYQRRYSKNIALASENIGSIRLIKHFAKEPKEAERFKQSVLSVRKVSMQIERLDTYLNTAIQMLAFAAMLVLLRLASDRLSVQDMELSESFSFLLYAVLLTRPLSGLMSVFGQWQSARGSLSRLTEIYQQPIEDLQQFSDAAMPQGDIEFENLKFSYEESRPVLAGINATVNRGEVVAIVGENGAGKSTLFNLLVRFYAPDSGKIKIGGVDIADVNLAALRKAIGVVSQHAQLKNGTLKENLLYGVDDRPGVELEESIAEVIEVVQLKEFVGQLPEGLNTPVGEDGVQLSGGQRQKLALARTLLVNPSILLLDESTSMFDEEAEQLFIRSCKELFEGKTVLISSHRPSILALADRILTLHDGKLK